MKLLKQMHLLLLLFLAAFIPLLPFSEYTNLIIQFLSLILLTGYAFYLVKKSGAI